MYNQNFIIHCVAIKEVMHLLEYCTEFTVIQGPETIIIVKMIRSLKVRLGHQN